MEFKKFKGAQLIKNRYKLNDSIGSEFSEEDEKSVSQKIIEQNKNYHAFNPFENEHNYTHRNFSFINNKINLNSSKDSFLTYGLTNKSHTRMGNFYFN
jgi:hypothetical protein